MEESLNLKSIFNLYGKKYMIKFKSLLLLNINHSSLHFNSINSINNSKISFKVGNFIIPKNSLPEWD